MKRTILVALLTMISTGTWSQEYWLIGAGNKDCGRYISENQVKGKDYYANTAWVDGFLSGVNAAFTSLKYKDITLGKASSAESRILWIENYCRANPLDNLAGATDALVAELNKRKTHTKTP